MTLYMSFDRCVLALIDAFSNILTVSQSLLGLILNVLDRLMSCPRRFNWQISKMSRQPTLCFLDVSLQTTFDPPALLLVDTMSRSAMATVVKVIPVIAIVAGGCVMGVACGVWSAMKPDVR